MLRSRQKLQKTHSESPAPSRHRSVLAMIVSFLSSYLCPAEVGSMRFVLLYVNFIYAILVISVVIYISIKYRQSAPSPAPEVDFFYDPLD